MEVTAEKPKIILPKIIKEPFQNRFLELTEDQYHADREAVHSSSLIRMIKSPHAYLHAISKPNKPTKAMRFGNIIHKALLEGSAFTKRYIVQPVFSGFTKDGIYTENANATSVKEAKAAWYAELPPDAIVVTQDERDRLLWMIDSVMKNEAACKLLKDGIPEAKGEWVDPVTQLRCIFSVDFLPNNADVQVELKSTTDCRWDKFRRSVEELRYDVQFQHYHQGLTAIRGRQPKYKVWIAIESDDDCEVMVHDVHPIYEATGADDWKKAMRDLKSCIVTNNFPQAQTIIEVGEPSVWFQKPFQERGVIL